MMLEVRRGRELSILYSLRLGIVESIFDIFSNLGDRDHILCQRCMTVLLWQALRAVMLVGRHFFSRCGSSAAVELLPSDACFACMSASTLPSISMWPGTYSRWMCSCQHLRFSLRIAVCISSRMYWAGCARLFCRAWIAA
jgi:hypothetical protein